MRQMSIDAAKRISLGAQGFTTKQVAGRIDSRHFRRVMGQVGLVQLDSVNVCVRSHYMPFYARLGPYATDHLDRWLNRSGENFEYWAHEAAVLPVERYPLWRWKMQTMHPWRRRAQALLDAHPGLMDDVLSQVEMKGPLTVRDLDAPSHRNEAWWGYGPGKVALEVLFAQGDVTALRTTNFTRLYDIPRRAIPSDLYENRRVDKGDAYRQLLIDAVRHCGIGTAADIADYFRLHVPTARSVLGALATDGVIEEVSVPEWRGPVYIDPDAVRPRNIVGATLLSPFDPVVWNRERAERLFGFHYRIEIYVPEPKRVFGYYVLPFLLDGNLVGRVDLKADRKTRTLLVRGSYVESQYGADEVAPALADELRRFADWLDLGDISIERNGNLSERLSKEM